LLLTSYQSCILRFSESFYTAVNWSSGIDYDVMLAKYPESYSEYLSYSHSKIANLLFTHELAKRLRRAGMDTLALAAHPGLANTNLHAEFNKKWFSSVVGFVRAFLSHDDVGGAMPIVMAAIDATPGLHAETYYCSDGTMESRGNPKAGARWRAYARDDILAEKLWRISEELTGFKYDI
jgi:NAD(P)-dependent dehydrogenase (short-subunit alcohol dehydrogenase family)